MSIPGYTYVQEARLDMRNPDIQWPACSQGEMLRSMNTGLTWRRFTVRFDGATEHSLRRMKVPKQREIYRHVVECLGGGPEHGPPLLPPVSPLVLPPAERPFTPTHAASPTLGPVISL